MVIGSPSYDSISPSPSPTPAQDMSKSTQTIMLAIPCVVVLLLTILVLNFARKGCKRRQEEEARIRQALAAQTPAQEPRTAAIGVTGLGLSGWSQHRQQLVADENLQLAGAGDVDTEEYAPLCSPKNPTGLAPALPTAQVLQSSKTML